MKFGYLTFSYANFAQFRDRLETTGAYSINLGDYMQTLAAKRLLARLGIPASDMSEVDRDTLARYDGEPVALIMNGCFYRWCFPLPPQIHPIFIGFQASEKVIVEFLDIFRQYQPIGCRDVETALRLRRHGVAAEVTGCLTLTFEQREERDREPCTMLIYGSGAGEFPPEALKAIPAELVGACEFVFQRKVVHEHPLGAAAVAQAEAHASSVA